MASKSSCEENIVVRLLVCEFVRRITEVTLSIQWTSSPEFRSVRHLSHLHPALCPLLFTTLKHGRVNYGEPGFHKFRYEIWSDKFNSQDPAPGSSRAQVTRARVHKYARSLVRFGLSARRTIQSGIQIIICMPTSCCDKRTTGVLTCPRDADSRGCESILSKDFEILTSLE